jgi:nucleotide-binding universal stress UspA family protein
VIERVLLAVDDTPDSLAAARAAVELAGAVHAQLRAIHVSTDHLLDAALTAASDQTAVLRREKAAVAVLERVCRMAEAAGVAVEADLLTGDVGPAILRVAGRWPADLVVVGRSARRTSGGTYVGAQTRHVLEFADQPVLVVAAPQHSIGVTPPA